MSYVMRRRRAVVSSGMFLMLLVILMVSSFGQTVQAQDWTRDSYVVEHVFTLTPGGTVVPNVNVHYFAHVWGEQNSPQCHDYAVVPAQSSGSFAGYPVPFGDRNIGSEEYLPPNTVQHTGVGGVLLNADIATAAISAAGGTSTVSATLPATCLKVRAEATCFYNVNPFGAGTPITGTIRSEGYAERDIQDDTLDVVCSFAFTDITAQGGRELLDGTIEWLSLVRDTAPVVGDTRIISDPIEFRVEDQVTAQVVTGTLLSIEWRPLKDFSTGGLTWEGGTASVSTADGEFTVDITSPYTTQRGYLELLVSGGEVVISVDNGMFDGVLPPIGTTVPFSFSLSNTTTIDYDLGDFDGHSVDVSLDFGGAGGTRAPQVPRFYASMPYPSVGYPDTIICGQPVDFHIYVSNPNHFVNEMSNGFRVYSPDGAEWEPLTWEIAAGLDTWFDGSLGVNEFSVTGSGADTLGFYGTVASSGDGNGYLDVLLRVEFLVPSEYAGKTICLDTCWYPPDGEWAWQTTDGEVIPEWEGPYCFTTKALPPPVIDSVWPRPDALRAFINGNISVWFDTDMDPATFTAGTFVVNGQSTGLHTGTYSYHAGDRMATFDPDRLFEAGEVVWVTLTEGITDDVGTQLDDPYVWSFTVAAKDGLATFDAHVDYPAGDDPRGVVTADLDNDGDPDIAATNSAGNDISVLMNFGDGTFGAQTVYAAGSQPWGITSGDWDEDGFIDLAAANNSGSNVSVFINNGSGGFNPQILYPVGSTARSISAADLDGDGHLDLAVASSATTTSVLLNNGDGTFAASVDYTVGTSHYTVAAGDVNVDGAVDLVTPNYTENTISLLTNDVGGTFGTHTLYSCGSHPTAIGVLSLNGPPNGDFDDAGADLAVANFAAATVSVLLNNSDGTFGAHTVYGVGSSPHGLCGTDLDGDRDIDLVTANYAGDDISVLLGNGNGTFQPHVSFACGAGPVAVVSADLDGDGDRDLVTANYDSDNVSVFINQDCCGLYTGGIRGNANCDDQGKLNLSDITALITRVYLDPEVPLCCEANGDVNCDGKINLSDITQVICYVYIDPLNCEPCPCP